MSRTYRRTIKHEWSTLGKIKAERRAEDSFYYYNWNWLNRSKAPSHWIRDYHTRPRRAQERELIGKLMKGERDPEGVVFPNGKKPFIYWN